jgi:SAM-dependent methyltransferase
MNAKELARNSAATEAPVVKDLNEDPILPYEDNSFDYVTCVVSVDYLTRPVEVFREVLRVLKPGGVFINSFSNRCFPTKATVIWSQTNDQQHCWICGSFYDCTGYTEIELIDTFAHEKGHDPLYIVQGRKPV